MEDPATVLRSVTDSHGGSAAGYTPGINTHMQHMHATNIVHKALLDSELVERSCNGHRGKLLKCEVSIVHKT